MSRSFKSFIQGYHHFPKEDVVYWDFTPILKVPEVRKLAIKELTQQCKGITTVASIESKGFILGSLIAHELDLPLVLIRKPGLTPGKVHKEQFIKEYGEAAYEMGENSLSKEDRVLLVYDILAGPGASLAAIELIKKAGARVMGCRYVIELCYLNGKDFLKEYPIHSLVKINQEDRDAIRSD